MSGITDAERRSKTDPALLMPTPVSAAIISWLPYREEKALNGKRSRGLALSNARITA
jgi:hypothetical protein